MGPADLAALLDLVAPSLEELVVERAGELLGPPAYAAMGRLAGLRVLCLRGIRSPLGEADFASLAQLTGLRELVLDCDQPPDADDGADEIKWGLQTFPDGVLHLTNLTHLTLSCHYGVTSLPDGLGALDALEVLNLDFCTLACLPPSLGRLTRLTTLDVEGNIYLGDTFRLGPGGGLGPPAPGAPPLPPAFPPALAGLAALRYVNLNSCGLRRAPDVLGSWTAVETVDLEDNDLGDDGGPAGGLPPSLSALTRLACLNIAQCKLARLPPVVERLPGLRILDLTNNRLAEGGLPPGLGRLPALRALGLKKNCLTSVPRLVGALTSLQELYIEDNADLEVAEPLDFVADLPHLRCVMMGKAWGSWSPRSMHHVAGFAARLRERHPGREVLRISYPGYQPQPPPGAA